MSANILWQPNPGPQTDALACPALELLFGGGAGGGKSDYLLVGPLRYVTYSAFRGAIFRRTFKELEAAKGLIERSYELYPAFGGRYNEQKKTWKFPGGARIQFHHLEHEHDAYDHKSTEYQYIGFDELTSFTRFQYTYLFSRARSTDTRIPIEVRSASNPEPGWVRDRWAPWVYSQYEGKRAESGEILWFAQDETGVEHYVPAGTKGAQSRCFIRSLLENTPQLARTDYGDRMRATLDIVQRARLLEGSWDAEYAAGIMFRKGMFRIVPPELIPRAAIRVRCWDLAATALKFEGKKSFEPTASNAPDYTAGPLYGWAPSFGYFVEDLEHFAAGPEVVRATVSRIATQDAARYGRRGVIIGVPQDPAQAGKDQAAAYVSMLKGYPVKVYKQTPARGGKVLRAGPLSMTAEHSGITLAKGPWNDKFIAEHEAFPKGTKDDIVDATAEGHWIIAGIPKVQESLYDDLPDMS